MSDATIAAATGIPVNFVRAIRVVESGGSPSAVRFEPHLFWRKHLRLPDGSTGPQIRDGLTPAQLAQVPYTPGNTDWRAAHGLAPCRISRSASCSAAETNRAAFARAYSLDPANAVRATSWGAFQTLGQHLLALHPVPAAAVAAFDASPATVSEALLVQWLRSNPDARDAARRSDVFNFVCRYNGCAGRGCANVSGCDTYKRKFMTALNTGSGSGGSGAVGAVLLAAGAWGLWKWLSVAALALLAGCGATPYATETARCAANEEVIVQRTGTTAEQDELDMAAERARCDEALAALRDGGVQ